MTILRIAVLIVFTMLLGATWQPAVADSANDWVNGKWTTGEGRWKQDLDLKVTEGNKITGKFTNTDPKGESMDGDVTGSVQGNKIHLDVDMGWSQPNYEIDLERVGSMLSGTRKSERRSWDHIFLKE